MLVEAEHPLDTVVPDEHGAPPRAWSSPELPSATSLLRDALDFVQSETYSQVLTLYLCLPVFSDGEEGKK